MKVIFFIFLFRFFKLALCSSGFATALACPYPDGIYAISEDCTSFLRCEGGNSRVVPCPRHLSFNPHKLTCDYTTEDSCIGKTSSSNPVEESFETDEYNCPTEGSSISPSRYSCSEYYRCMNGTAYKERCPTGLVMNKQVLTCDYEEEVPCDVFRQRRLLQDDGTYDNDDEIDDQVEEATASSVPEENESNDLPKSSDAGNGGENEDDSDNNAESKDPVNVGENEDESENDPESNDAVNVNENEDGTHNDPESSDAVKVENNEDEVGNDLEDGDKVNAPENEDVGLTDILMPTATSYINTYETTSEVLSPTEKMKTSAPGMIESKTVKSEGNIFSTENINEVNSNSPSPQSEKYPISSTLSYDKAISHSPNPSPKSVATIAIQEKTTVTESMYISKDTHATTSLETNDMQNQNVTNARESESISEYLSTAHGLELDVPDATESSEQTKLKYKTELLPSNTTDLPTDSQNYISLAQSNFTTETLLTSSNEVSDTQSSSINEVDESYDIVSDAEPTSEILTLKKINSSTEFSYQLTTHKPLNSSLNATTLPVTNTTDIFNTNTTTTAPYNNKTNETSLEINEDVKANVTEKSMRSSTASVVDYTSEKNGLFNTSTQQNEMLTSAYKSNSERFQDTTPTLIGSSLTNVKVSVDITSQKLETSTESNLEENTSGKLSNMTTTAMEITTVGGQNSVQKKPLNEKMSSANSTIIDEEISSMSPATLEKQMTSVQTTDVETITFDKQSNSVESFPDYEQTSTVETTLNGLQSNGRTSSILIDGSRTSVSTTMISSETIFKDNQTGPIETTTKYFSNSFKSTKFSNHENSLETTSEEQLSNLTVSTVEESFLMNHTTEEEKTLNSTMFPQEQNTYKNTPSTKKELNNGVVTVTENEPVIVETMTEKEKIKTETTEVDNPIDVITESSDKKRDLVPSTTDEYPYSVESFTIDEQLNTERSKITDEMPRSIEAVTTVISLSNGPTSKSLEYLSTLSAPLSNKQVISANSNTTEQQTTVETRLISEHSNDAVNGPTSKHPSSIGIMATDNLKRDLETTTEVQEQTFKITTEEIPLSIPAIETEEQTIGTDTTRITTQATSLKSTLGGNTTNNEEPGTVMSITNTSKSMDLLNLVKTTPRYEEVTRQKTTGSGTVRPSTVRDIAFSTIIEEAPGNKEENEKNPSNSRSTISTEGLSNTSESELEKELPTSPFAAENKVITTDSTTKEMPSTEQGTTDAESVIVTKENLGNIGTGIMKEGFTDTSTATAEEETSVSAVVSTTQDILSRFDFTTTEVQPGNTTETTTNYKLSFDTTKKATDQPSIIFASVSTELLNKMSSTPDVMAKLSDIVTSEEYIKTDSPITTEKYLSSVNLSSTDDYSSSLVIVQTEAFETSANTSVSRESDKTIVTAEKDPSSVRTTNTYEHQSNTDTTLREKQPEIIHTTATEKYFSNIHTTISEKHPSSLDNSAVQNYPASKGTLTTENESTEDLVTEEYSNGIYAITSEQYHNKFDPTEQALSSLRTAEINKYISTMKSNLTETYSSSINITTTGIYSSATDTSSTDVSSSVIPQTEVEVQWNNASETWTTEEKNSSITTVSVGEPSSINTGKTDEYPVNMFSTFPGKTLSTLTTETTENEPTILDKTVTQEYPGDISNTKTDKYSSTTGTIVIEKYLEKMDTTTINDDAKSTDASKNLENKSSTHSIDEKYPSLDTITPKRYLLVTTTQRLDDSTLPSEPEDHLSSLSTKMTDDRNIMNITASGEQINNMDPVTNKYDPLSINITADDNSGSTDSSRTKEYRSSTEAIDIKKSPTTTDIIPSEKYLFSSITAAQELSISVTSLEAGDLKNNESTTARDVKSTEYDEQLNNISNNTTGKYSISVSTMTEKSPSSMDTTTDKYSRIMEASPQKYFSIMDSTTDKYPSTLDTTTDKIPSSKYATEKYSIIMDTTEEYSSILDTTTEKHSSIIDTTTEKQSSIMDTTEKHSSIMDTTEKHSSIIDTTEEHSSIMDTTEKHSSIMDTTEKNSSITDTTTEKYSSIMDTTTENQSRIMDTATEKHYSITDTTTEKYSSIMDTTTEKQSSIMDTATEKHSSITNTTTEKYSSISDFTAKKHSSITDTAAEKYSSITDTKTEKYSSITGTKTEKYSSITGTTTEKYSSIMDTTTEKYSSDMDTTTEKYSSDMDTTTEKHSSIMDITTEKRFSIMDTTTEKHSSITKATAQKYPSSMDTTIDKHTSTDDTNTDKYSIIMGTRTDKYSRTTDATTEKYSRIMDTTEESLSRTDANNDKYSSVFDNTTGKYPSSMDVTSDKYSSIINTTTDKYLSTTDRSTDKYSSTKDSTTGKYPSVINKITNKNSSIIDTTTENYFITINDTTRNYSNNTDPTTARYPISFDTTSHPSQFDTYKSEKYSSSNDSFTTEESSSKIDTVTSEGNRVSSNTVTETQSNIKLSVETEDQAGYMSTTVTEQGISSVKTTEADDQLTYIDTTNDEKYIKSSYITTDEYTSNFETITDKYRNVIDSTKPSSIGSIATQKYPNNIDLITTEKYVSSIEFTPVEKDLYSLVTTTEGQNSNVSLPETEDNLSNMHTTRTEKEMNDVITSITEKQLSSIYNIATDKHPIRLSSATTEEYLPSSYTTATGKQLSSITTEVIENDSNHPQTISSEEQLSSRPTPFTGQPSSVKSIQEEESSAATTTTKTSLNFAFPTSEFSNSVTTSNEDQRSTSGMEVTEGELNSTASGVERELYSPELTSTSVSPRGSRIENSTNFEVYYASETFTEASKETTIKHELQENPTVYNCIDRDGIFADSNDCSNFVQCLNGLPYFQSCPDGLFFNTRKRTCDFEKDCGSEAGIPTSRNTEISCDCQNCLMPDSEDCTRYYICLNGNGYDLKCSDGLRFNPEILTCDYEGNVTCAKSSIECPTPNGYAKDSDNCSRYFHCVGGIAYRKTCKTGQHFNRVTNGCDDPCLAGCDPNGCIEASTLVPSPICVEGDGFYPHPENCDTFYKCSNGNAEIAFCADDTHFSPTARMCQEVCEALCDHSLDCVKNIVGSTKHSTDLTTTTTKISPTYAESTTNLIFTSTTFESTRFETTMHSLPSDQLMTNESETNAVSTTEAIGTESTVTTISDVSSEDSSTLITELTSLQSTTISPICKTPDGVYSKPGDCSSFYICMSGIPTEQKCDRHLHFSQITLKCEFPCYAKCDMTIDCSTTQVPDLSTHQPLSLCIQKDLLPGRQCYQYINCTSGMPFTRRCPVGLHFNPTTRVCDWPKNAGCGKPGSFPEVNKHYNCPCENCLVPAQDNCVKYHLCIGYVAYTSMCSTGLLFDSNLNTCNQASKVYCERGMITTSPTTTVMTSTITSTTVKTTTPAEVFKCPRREGYFQKPNDCGRFIQCANGRPYDLKCPSTLHFSMTTLRCEYPCDAKCDLNLACLSTSQPSKTDKICGCLNCKVKDPESCTKYIECRNGKARTIHCRPGQTFDSGRGACDWAHKVKCHSQTCPKLNGLFPYEGDCQKFIHCANGIPYINKCHHILEFDPVTSRCTWPSGRCGITTPMPPTLKPDNKSLKDFKCPKSFGFFQDEESCNRFYHCSHGIPYVRECPQGLVFNPKNQICDWKANVKCDPKRQYYQRRCRMYDRHVTCPQSRVHIQHSNCDMFYDCSTGSGCAKRCPVGLYFNSTTAVCDRPENVQCPNGKNEFYSLKEFAITCYSKGIGYMTDPALSHCFYRCHQEKVTRGCCPRNAVFNVEKEKCEINRRRLFS